MDSLNIKSSSSTYHVDFFEVTDALLDSLASQKPERRLLIVDERITRMHPKIMNLSCSASLKVEATEKLKSFPDGVSTVFNFLIQQRPIKARSCLRLAQRDTRCRSFCSSLFHGDSMAISANNSPFNGR